jgi:hypothetical protein
MSFVEFVEPRIEPLKFHLRPSSKVGSIRGQTHHANVLVGDTADRSRGRRHEDEPALCSNDRVCGPHVPNVIDWPICTPPDLTSPSPHPWDLINKNIGLTFRVGYVFVFMANGDEAGRKRSSSRWGGPARRALSATPI